MGIGEANIENIMGGIENTGTVRMNNHKRKLKQRFVIIKKLGQGTYGKVKLGVNKETGQEVAIKTIKKSKIETEADLIRIRREIQIMSSVQHPNIIHIYEVFENREKMVLVMEYAAGGELYDYLSERKVLVETEARRIFRQISTACYYCHKHKICHRDLKLENILLDESGNAKIADFGLSNVFDDTRLLSTFCGSPLYASPEIVNGTSYIGPEVDCWSLGVLLYTLVYGAMPFDGSNFKKLVKQISSSDYFEPKKPSAASPLIREMLDVSPHSRANIERICSHWWVNEGYNESCLELSEDLANQTPVRLDLLLSLAPPPPQLESEKLVVLPIPEADTHVPTRSQSAGNLIEQTNAAERRIAKLITDPDPSCMTEAHKMTPKRKLETAASSDHIEDLLEKRRDKIVKDSTGADISIHQPISSLSQVVEECDEKRTPAAKDQQEPSLRDIGSTTMLDRSRTQTLNKDSQEMEEEAVDGAACTEILEEQARKQVLLQQVSSPKTAEVLSDKEALAAAADGKENNTESNLIKGEETLINVSSAPPIKNTVKKKILSDKNDNSSSRDDANKKVVKTAKTKSTSNSASAKSEDDVKVQEKKKIVSKIPEASVGSVKTEAEVKKSPEPSKQPSTVRRRSTIFEQAEKIQNMLSASTAEADKPVKKDSQSPPQKKLIIPGVSVGGFKREFERKASLTSSSSKQKLRVTPSKKHVIQDRSVDLQDEDKTVAVVGTNSESKSLDLPGKESNHEELAEKFESKPKGEMEMDPNKELESQSVLPDGKEVNILPPDHKPSVDFAVAPNEVVPMPTPEEVQTVPKNASIAVTDDRQKKVKNAVNIIGNALDMDGTRKSKSRPCMIRKPPVPFGVSGRSASGSIATIAPALLSERKLVKMQSTPSPCLDTLSNLSPPLPSEPEEKVSSAEIILKSATLPRRKTTKAEIQLDYPKPTGQSAMGFRTEMSHHVPTPPAQQRSEATFPIFAPTGLRATPVNTETPKQNSLKERIIPIAFEREDKNVGSISPNSRLPQRNLFATQKPNVSQRSTSLSRQTSQEFDTESQNVSSPVSGEPIKKSPREYIIPIAVEGGGYVTPRAGSLEPSGDSKTPSVNTSLSSRSKFGRRWKAPFDRDGSEDESPFPAFRYNSIGRDSDSEENSNPFHLHRLRSSRRPPNIEHTDSVSSGEDDDDDGFDILTAENLFSHLLARVRDLTHRIKTDDVHRPRFPNNRLLGNFDHHSSFFPSLHQPASRNLPGRTLSHEFGTAPGVAGNTPWRRSVSRDLAADIQSVFNDMSPNTTSQATTLPRGDRQSPTIDSSISANAAQSLLPNAYSTSSSRASKFARTNSAGHCDGPGLLGGSATDSRSKTGLQLTPEDAIALSLLTPGLSRRIQRQLFAQLPATASGRKLVRTLSASAGNQHHQDGADTAHDAVIDSSVHGGEHNKRCGGRYSAASIPATLPRKSSYDMKISSSTDCCEPSFARNRNASYTENNATPALGHSSTSAGRSRYNTSNLDSNRPYNSDLKAPLYVNEDLSSQRSKSALPTTASTTRRVSRFLRPDFYDYRPKSPVASSVSASSIAVTDSATMREKRERELETQHVLKEIRDKRIRNRLNVRRERSASRERDIVSDISAEALQSFVPASAVSSSEDGVKKVSASRENVEVNSKLGAIGVKENGNGNPSLTCCIAAVPAESDCHYAKKERISKLIRPKSYPTEKVDLNNSAKIVNEAATEPKTRTSKLKRVFTGNSNKNGVATPKDSDGGKSAPTSSASSSKLSTTRNKFLKTIERKFEKLRAFSSNEDDKAKVSKHADNDPDDNEKTRVEGAIRKLREHSVPAQGDSAITESVLIKRAVSMEDCSNAQSANKALQPSRRSVTKILGLFKKYEDKDARKTAPAAAVQQECQPVKKVVESEMNVLGEISESNIPKPKTATKVVVPASMASKFDECARDRPKSLLIDSFKSQMSAAVPASIDTNLIEPALSKSRLPTSRRTSLNFDDPATAAVTSPEPPPLTSNTLWCGGSKSTFSGGTIKDARQSVRKQLKLDLSKVPSITSSTFSPDNQVALMPNRNPSLPVMISTSSCSTLSPSCDDNDNSCCDDSWSVCSSSTTTTQHDHTLALMSPLSDNGNHMLQLQSPLSENGASGNFCGLQLDEAASTSAEESVIDRIRRKSFYTRFNDTKKPRTVRKPSAASYRDLDLYRDIYSTTSRSKTPTNAYHHNYNTSNSRSTSNIGSTTTYHSLDRRSTTVGEHTYGNNNTANCTSRQSSVESDDCAGASRMRNYRSYGRSASLNLPTSACVLSDYAPKSVTSCAYNNGNHRAHGECNSSHHSSAATNGGAASLAGTAQSDDKSLNKDLLLTKYTK